MVAHSWPGTEAPEDTGCRWSRALSLHLRPRAHLTLFMAAPTVAPCQSPSGPHPASLGLRDTRFSPPSWLTENPALAMNKCLSVLSATSFRHDL